MSSFAYSETTGWLLVFNNSRVNLDAYNRTNGYSVRCVARAEDTTAVFNCSLYL